MAFAQIAQTYAQKCKVVAHVFQILFIFIAGCITLAVMTKGGEIGGPTRWFFALCFITIPAMLYLVMVPMWARTVRFANVFAFVAVDALFMIFWLSAFIAVAAWNAAGINQGARDRPEGEAEGDGDCSTFAYGSESKCNLSKATVGLGVVVFILFALTTAISFYWVMRFRKHGESPFSSDPRPRTTGLEAPKEDHDADWSADTADIDGAPDAQNDGGDGRYGLLHSTDTEEGAHPGRPIDWSSTDDTAYHGNNQRYQEPASALSPGGYEDYRRSAAPATYDSGYDAPHNQPAYQDEGRVNRGYSFSGGDRI